MNEYKITETFIYYVEAEDAGEALAIVNSPEFDRANAKNSYVEVEVA